MGAYMAETYIKMVELVRIIGHAHGMILRMMNKNDKAAYDPTFPAPVPIGNKSEAWRKSDIDRWMFEREMAAIEAAHYAESQAAIVEKQKQQAEAVAACRASQKAKMLSGEARRQEHEEEWELEAVELQAFSARNQAAKYRLLDLVYWNDEIEYLARYRRLEVKKYGKARRYHYSFRFLMLPAVYYAMNSIYCNAGGGGYDVIIEIDKLKAQNKAAFDRLNDDYCKISIL